MLKFLAIVLGLTVIAACSVQSQTPQSQTPAWQAARIASIGVENTPRLGAYGYDLVERFPKGTHDAELGQLQSGSSATIVEYQNVTFRFVSSVNRETFRQDPERYLPGMGGYCANAMRNQNLAMVVGNPENVLYVDGMWYVFGRKVGLDAFVAATAETRTKWLKTGWDFYRRQTGQ
jgi:YHS domain-containing protein